MNYSPKDSVDPKNYKIGDLVLDKSTWILWQNQNNIWAELGSIKGPQGPQGNKGDKGDKGDTGSYTKATYVTNSNAAVSLQMQQSTYYKLTNSAITSITLSLGTVTSGTVGEFMLEFNITSGNAAPTINLPSGVGYANGWTKADFVSGHTYIIYILNTTAYVSWK